MPAFALLLMMYSRTLQAQAFPLTARFAFVTTGQSHVARPKHLPLNPAMIRPCQCDFPALTTAIREKAEMVSCLPQSLEFGPRKNYEMSN